MKTIITSILGLALFAFSLPVYGGTLDAELDYKVQAIAQYMKGKDYTQLSLLPIGGISEATGTSRIAAIITDKLATHNIQMVGAGAPVQLDIEVSLGPDDATLSIEIELKTDRGQKLRDWTGQFEYEAGGAKVQVNVESGSTTAQIDYADDVQKILSIPYADHELPPDPKKANKVKLKELSVAYSHPVSYVKEESHVSSHESGLYQMEVVTTKDPGYASDSYSPVSATSDSGFSFVELSKGDLVGVRLYNNSDEIAAVEVCLDGISSFYFSKTKIKHYQIPPHKSILVRGFHQDFDAQTNEHHYKHFQIVDFTDSAWLKAQETGFASVADAQGSISAHFSKEAPKTRGADGAPDSPLFGQGEDFKEVAKVEKMKIGPICETIVARYHKPKAN